MSLSEALKEGMLVTGVGLLIVFSVLIILMLVMMAMKKIFYKEDKPKTENNAPTPSAPAVVQNVQGDDTQLIAVITAAIAASLNTSTYNLNIRSFKRVGNSTPDWSKAGLRENIDSRF